MHVLSRQYQREIETCESIRVCREFMKYCRQWVKLLGDLQWKNKRKNYGNENLVMLMKFWFHWKVSSDNFQYRHLVDMMILSLSE